MMKEYRFIHSFIQSFFHSFIHSFTHSFIPSLSHSQGPGQYFLRPMMKEYRFEPQSQMIDVKEGATVQVEVTSTRVAYRYRRIVCGSRVCVRVDVFVCVCVRVDVCVCACVCEDRKKGCTGFSSHSHKTNQQVADPKPVSLLLPKMFDPRSPSGTSSPCVFLERRHENTAVVFHDRSCYGKVTSLNGEAEPAVVLEAVSRRDDAGAGAAGCENLQEETKTEQDGAFRIRGLQVGAAAGWNSHR